jgi:hypothetical protein
MGIFTKLTLGAMVVLFLGLVTTGWLLKNAYQDLAREEILRKAAEDRAQHAENMQEVVNNAMGQLVNRLGSINKSVNGVRNAVRKAGNTGTVPPAVDAALDELREHWEKRDSGG